MIAVFAAALLAGLALGAGGSALMLARARRGQLPVDLPDERRLHQTPTPRGGGIGILAAGVAVVPLALWIADRERMLVVAAALFALANGLMGWWDDHRPMRSRTKFAIQTAAAIAAVALGLRLDVVALPPLGELTLGPAAWPVSVLFLVWTANVFNFMDGMDALAAGSGVLFCAGYVVWGVQAAPALAVLALGLGGGFLGFLRDNRPPARIFMGDGGSLFAGAMLGGLALAFATPGIAVPIAAPVVLMGTFLWDATYTIIRRFLRGDPMLPHRTHIFQRLALSGWSHARVRGVYLGLAALYLLGALVLARGPAGLQALVIGVALVASLILAGLAERRP